MPDTAFLGPDVRDLGSAWIDPSARIFGDVEIGEQASIWCNVVVRAESHEVVIGPRTNVQDFVMIHVGTATGTIIGADCSITHHVTLHGCRIGDAVPDRDRRDDHGRLRDRRGLDRGRRRLPEGGHDHPAPLHRHGLARDGEVHPATVRCRTG